MNSAFLVEGEIESMTQATQADFQPNANLCHEPVSNILLCN
jgi:hypothetical protein